MGLFHFISPSAASLKTERGGGGHVAMDASKMSEGYLAGEQKRPSVLQRNPFWALQLYLVSQGVGFHAFNALQESSAFPRWQEGHAFQVEESPNLDPFKYLQSISSKIRGQINQGFWTALTIQLTCVSWKIKLNLLPICSGDKHN